MDLYIPSIIDEINLSNQPFLVEEFHFKNTIGKTIILETTSKDQIIYAIRNNRLGHSRFVLDKKPKDSNYLTVILQKQHENWLIISAYIGRKMIHEPWNSKAKKVNIDFWNNYAFVYQKENIVETSETKYCPWQLNKHSICKLHTAFYKVSQVNDKD